jgi:hypothetical protein
VANDGADAVHLALHIRALKNTAGDQPQDQQGLRLEVPPTCSRADQVIE